MAQYKTLNNFANEFSTSATYAVGDLCMYQGELYRCTTAHSGAWNASNFGKTNVMGVAQSIEPATVALTYALQAEPEGDFTIEMTISDSAKVAEIQKVLNDDKGSLLLTITIPDGSGGTTEYYKAMMNKQLSGGTYTFFSSTVVMNQGIMTVAANLYIDSSVGYLYGKFENIQVATGTIPTVTLNGSTSTSPTFYAATSAGTSGKFLRSAGDNSAPTWADAPSELPSTLGTAGQVLTVNAGATGVEWADAQGGGGKEIEVIDLYNETATRTSLNQLLNKLGINKNISKTYMFNASLKYKDQMGTGYGEYGVSGLFFIEVLAGLFITINVIGQNNMIYRSGEIGSSSISNKYLIDIFGPSKRSYIISTTDKYQPNDDGTYVLKSVNGTIQWVKEN